MDAETEARKEGWRPLEEFKGDPDKWVDAEEFIARGEQFLPLVRAARDKAREEFAEFRKEAAAEIDSLKREMEETKAAGAEFRQFQKELGAKQKELHDREVANLKQQMKVAAENGDTKELYELGEELEQRKAAAPTVPADPEPKQKSSGEMTPEEQKIWDSWVADNQWYEKNAQMRYLVNGFAAEMTTPLQGQEFLDALRKEAERVFPDEFRNTKRDRQDTGSGHPISGSPGDRTYDDLPAEDKAACDRFVKEIKGFTREQYLEDYIWDDQL